MQTNKYIRNFIIIILIIFMLGGISMAAPIPSVSNNRDSYFLLSPMQRRKERQRDRLFVPPSLTVLKYRDSKGLRGKLVNW